MFVNNEDNLREKKSEPDQDFLEIENLDNLVKPDEPRYLKNRINSLSSLNEQLANMHEPHLWTSSELTKHGVLCPKTNNDIKKIFSELSYRIIRKVNNNAVITVTSISRESGNSFVALNLAISISYYEPRTSLLIECDKTKSSRYAHLINNKETKNLKGLSDYLLTNEIIEDEIVHPIGIPKIRLIPAGTERIPGEYYGSVKMLQLIANAKDRYPERYILIDAPAIKESSYTALLADLSDYVLVVVPYGKVMPRDLMFAADIIGEEKLLGFVFNNKPSIKFF
jgi:Mrp family chromosome partitioning ATPase